MTTLEIIIGILFIIAVFLNFTVDMILIKQTKMNSTMIELLKKENSSLHEENKNQRLAIEFILKNIGYDGLYENGIFGPLMNMSANLNIDPNDFELDEIDNGVLAQSPINLSKVVKFNTINEEAEEGTEEE